MLLSPFAPSAEAPTYLPNGVRATSGTRGRHRAPDIDDRETASAPVTRPPEGTDVITDLATDCVTDLATDCVTGVRCSAGHFNDPAVRYCLSCGRSMAHADRKLVPGLRPPVGVVVLDDGTTRALDVDLVLGSAPATDPEVVAGKAAELRLAGVDVQPVHARLLMRGWDVRVVDCGSDGRTAIAGPDHVGFSPLPPHTPTVIASGTRVRVGERSFVFTSRSAPATASPVAAAHRRSPVRRWASAAPARLRAVPLAIATLSSVAALVLLVALGVRLQQTVFIPPLAASMALVAGAPHLPLGQPRNVIGGQFVSALVGLGTFAVVGSSTWAAAVAGGLALGAMLLTRTSHSPAAATAAIAASAGPPPVLFLALLTLAAVVLVLVGIVGAWAAGNKKYPVYWW